MNAPYVGQVRLSYLRRFEHSLLPSAKIVITNVEEEQRGRDDCHAVVDDGSKHVGVLCPKTGDTLAITGPADDERSLADARLFAASRQLRDVLREALPVLRANAMTFDPAEYPTAAKQARQLLNDAQAALRLAETGEAE